MTQVLVLTHGDFAAGIKSSVDLLLGETDDIGIVALHEGDDIVEFKSKVEQKLEGIDDEEGAFVLVDICGGSPYNTIAQCLQGRNIECLAGVNLPMLIEAVMGARSGKSPQELALLCRTSGEVGIVDVRKRLNIA